MKAATAIGIGIAAIAIIMAGIMEGVTPTALLNINALILVLGGTAGAVFGGVGMKRFMAIPKLYMKAILSQQPNLAERVTTLVAFAERARKDGLLALEEEIEAIEDPFTRKGMQLVVDGTDPDLLREILEAEIDAMAARHKLGSSVFEKAGGIAPTIGVLGTVVSLVHVLGNLSAPETLGPAISGAFIATLYGVGSANVVYLPVCYSLQMMSAKEVDERSLILEGVLAIQAGDNPRIVQQKLLSYVAPAERLEVEGGGKADLKAVAEPAAEAA
ncbi:motility protein A [Baekduia soli]|uniref:Motility protein A n=1 Tax=Baekduia soli TaxID=496014 RepID=A0A5B8U1J6_9ACTN|nr:MotA/TolQ/ExbB proton channel family protein [Baekduia soli]QEC46856.1 motility protein A [Baekduia soli]